MPKAKDECQVRKLTWFYALPKLPLFISANLLYILYIVLATPIIFFFGYWPISIKDAVKRIIGPVQNNWSLDVRAVCSDTKMLHIYKNGEDTERRLWFSPFYLLIFVQMVILEAFLLLEATNNSFILLITLVLAVTAIPGLLYLNLKRFFNYNSSTVSGIIGIILLLAISISALIFGNPPANKVNQYFSIPFTFLSIFVISIIISSRSGIIKYLEKITHKYNASTKKDEKYSEYLVKNFTKPENKVSLNNLPDTFSISQAKRSLKIYFWTTKKRFAGPMKVNKRSLCANRGFLIKNLL